MDFMEKAMHSYEIINNLLLAVILGILIIVDLAVTWIRQRNLFFVSCKNERISSG